MSAEIKVEDPEIVLVSPGGKAELGACQPDYPDGPCQPMQRPCNPQCAPACLPSVIPKDCGPTRGDPRPPSSPPGLN